jgi:hypothetical protein
MMTSERAASTDRSRFVPGAPTPSEYGAPR